MCFHHLIIASELIVIEEKISIHNSNVNVFYLNQLNFDKSENKLNNFALFHSKKTFIMFEKVNKK